MDSRTRAYADRRTAQGKTKKEIMRCLKRYVARELFRQLTNPQAAPVIADLRPARQELHITLREAAGYLNTWPGTISRIERGLSRDDDLATQIRDRLHERKDMQRISWQLSGIT
jgi:transposase